MPRCWSDARSIASSGLSRIATWINKVPVMPRSPQTSSTAISTTVADRGDPTLAAADLEALKSQVAAYSAQVSRMQSEMENRPFAYTGSDPHLALQAAIYAQRQSEYNFKLEGYRQKADSLSAQIAKARSDV